MIKFENTEVCGIRHAIRGMRNAMNSWKTSDSYASIIYNTFELGKNDKVLAMQLSKAGTDHRKFLRMITVYADITVPLYWWKEFDTYKVGTTSNSCSTMHKLTAKEFTIEDFSFEDCDKWTKDVVCSCIINALNMNRLKYLETKDKKLWRQMIQLLPTSYNQKRTVMLNYEVLANIYKSRQGHKLNEWHDFIEWIERLPYTDIFK